ncbi:MAG: protein kinase, partial [Acidobacteria bacterium]|nr:protein kinase [Acidobacteriota bacterium]
MGTQTSPDKFINKTLNNRYQIARILGIGALGTVYLAKDTRINKNVAVKVLTGSVSNDDIKRFKRECNFLASFNHPNIVGVFDHDVTAMEENNYYFLVMEYVNGITLKEFLKTSDSLPLENKLNIACQIC